MGGTVQSQEPEPGGSRDHQVKASSIAFRAFWLLYFVFVIILFAVLLKGCASKPPIRQALPPLQKAQETTIEQVFNRPVEGVLRSAISVVAPNEGKIWATYGLTACHPAGGVNPYIFIPMVPTHPHVGDVVELLFTTRALRPFPSEDMYLVWSNTLLAEGIDFTPYGMPGCRLLIDPQQIVRIPAEQSMSGMVTHVAGSGEALLRWTAPSWSAGMRLYVQLVTLSPGETPSGYICSHCVEVLIGS